VEKPHEKLPERRLKFSPRISGGCIPRGSSLLDSHRANPEMEFGKDPNKVQEDELPIKTAAIISISTLETQPRGVGVCG